MGESRWPVERAVLLHVEIPAAGQGRHERTVWRYGSADPWAVHVDFGDDNVWRFARELVAGGLHGPAGLGDVQVYPHRGRVGMRMESPEGRCLLTARRGDLLGFLAATYRVVPHGGESAHVDLDAAVALVLGEAGRC